MKKIIVILLCMALCCAGVFAASAAGDTYVVAGSEKLCNGELWAATSDVNTMTANANGIYSIIFYNIQPGNYEFKIVKNGGEWIGDPDNWGNNYAITVKKACDVTITYDPSTGYATAKGSGVGAAEAPEISVMSIRGEGLGILDWNTGVAMDKVSDGVYEYTFHNLSGVTLVIKFAANGNWEDYNFGGAFTASGEETGAVWSGENISIPVNSAVDVTVRLDVRHLDYTSKQGATFTITFSAPATAPDVETEPAEPETEPAVTGTQPAGSDQQTEATDFTVTVEDESPKPTESVDESAEPSGGQKDDASASGSRSGLIVGIVVAVVAVAAVVMALVLRKKK